MARGSTLKTARRKAPQARNKTTRRKRDKAESKPAPRGGLQAQEMIQGSGGKSIEQAPPTMEGGIEAAARSAFSGPAQTAGREWLAYFQGAAFRNVRTMSQLARCRTMREVMEAQSKRLSEEFGEFAECSRRIYERLLNAGEDAAGDSSRRQILLGS